MKALLNIQGEGLDIKDIEAVIGRDSSLKIVQIDRESCFEVDINSEDDIKKIRDNLISRLITLNGIAKYFNKNHKSVRAGHAKVDHGDGNISSYFYAEPGVTRSRAYGSVHVTGPGARAGQSLLELALGDRFIEDIFRMIEIEGYSWVNLYRIFEAFTEKVTKDVIIKMYGIPEPVLKLFKKTANDKKVLGMFARHGKHEKNSECGPPYVPMTQIDAIALIDNLISKYLTNAV